MICHRIIYIINGQYLTPPAPAPLFVLWITAENKALVFDPNSRKIPSC
jgi:hypothetical protein